MVGTGTALIGGAIYGATVGAASTASGTGLETYFTGLIGGGIGFMNLKIQHPFNSYFNKNFNNLKTDIKNWSEWNQPSIR